MIEKYRVHEVAKDLGIPSKDLIALLEANFPGEPKKHMTALTDAELNLVFDKFTRERSLPNLESYFALQSQRPKAPAPKPAPKAEEQPAPPAPQPAPAPKAEEKPAAPAPRGEERPAAPAPKPAPAAPGRIGGSTLSATLGQ